MLKQQNACIGVQNYAPSIRVWVSTNFKGLLVTLFLTLWNPHISENLLIQKLFVSLGKHKHTKKTFLHVNEIVYFYSHYMTWPPNILAVEGNQATLSFRGIVKTCYKCFRLGHIHYFKSSIKTQLNIWSIRNKQGNPKLSQSFLRREH